MSTTTTSLPDLLQICWAEAPVTQVQSEPIDYQILWSQQQYLVVMLRQLQTQNVRWHVKFKDTKDIQLLSTLRANSPATAYNRNKSLSVVDYSKYLSEADLADKMPRLTLQKKAKKWYQKLAFHWMQLAEYDAIVLYRKRVSTFNKHPIVSVWWRSRGRTYST